MDNQLLKNLKVLVYKFFKNRLSTPLSTLRNSWYWRSLSLPGAPWRSLALPGASWRSVSLPGAPWRSLALLGAPWRFLALRGVPWRCHWAGWPVRQNSRVRTNIYGAAISACEKAIELNRIRESIGLCVCVYIYVCTIRVSWPRLTSCVILQQALDGKNKRHS